MMEKVTTYDPSMGDILNYLMSPLITFPIDGNAINAPPIFGGTNDEKQVDSLLFEPVSQTDLTSRVREVAEQLNTALPKTVVEARAEILAGLSKTEAMQEQLCQKLGRYVDGTETLISREGAALSFEVNKATSDMQAALAKTQTDLTSRVQEVAEQLNTALPKTVVEARAEILARLAEGVATQERLLHAELNQLNPLLDRIESYGMAAARRVAIPCGVGAVMVRTSVGYVLCENEDHALIATLIECGELELGTRHLIQRILEPGDVFVDVGANIGMHSLAAAHAMRGQGRVIALEPFLPTARLLKKTIWMNGFTNMVEIHCAAASNEQCERTLHLGATSGHHSLFPLDEISSTDSVTVKVHTTTVDIITANSLVNLFKIDAEGAELEVLEGAAALLKRSNDIGIIAEFGRHHLNRIGVTPDEWFDRFRKLGLKCQAIHPSTGVLDDISIDELEKIESINLFFARPRSPIWKKARGAK